MLQQVVDDLVAVLSEVGLATDVNPIRAVLVVLPDKLVEGQIVANEVEPPSAYFERWKVEVGSLALHVLACTDTAYCLVDLRTAIAARYGDGVAIPVAQRLQDVLAEVGECVDDVERGCVVQAKALCRAGLRELAQTEILG